MDSTAPTVAMLSILIQVGRPGGLARSISDLVPRLRLASTQYKTSNNVILAMCFSIALYAHSPGLLERSHVNGFGRRIEKNSFIMLVSYVFIGNQRSP